MLRIVLVRHGMTHGNTEKRFIGGRTDEPVCQEGQEELCRREYPEVEKVYTSPMLRCRQTACLAFYEEQPDVIEEFRECDFGILEGKNHGELSGDPVYEAFLKQGGNAPFPGGESVEEFGVRSFKGFQKVVEDCIRNGYHTAACTVHGGTIMALLSRLKPETKNYYDWYVKNGEGYWLELDEKKWQEGVYDAEVLNCFGSRIYS